MALEGAGMSNRHFFDVENLGNDGIREILKSVTVSGECCYLTSNGGSPKAVVLDVSYYHSLMDIIEDAENGGKSDYRHMRELLNEIVPMPRRKST